MEERALNLLWMMLKLLSWIAGVGANGSPLCLFDALGSPGNKKQETAE